MFKRITGKGIRLDTVRAWLALPDTVRIRSEYERDTGFVPKNGFPDTRQIQPGYVRARDDLGNYNYKGNGKRKNDWVTPDLPLAERTANIERLAALSAEVLG